MAYDEATRILIAAELAARNEQRRGIDAVNEGYVLMPPFDPPLVPPAGWDQDEVPEAMTTEAALPNLGELMAEFRAGRLDEQRRAEPDARSGGE